jgi:hypothetical protein
LPARTFSASKSYGKQNVNILKKRFIHVVHFVVVCLFFFEISNLFVKKENNGYRPEPPVIPNGFEKVKGFT